jgi:hypothetical protein
MYLLAIMAVIIVIIVVAGFGENNGCTLHQ